MSFADESRKLGRIPLEFVDITMGWCGNTSGVSPCVSTATGDDKCCNTYGTCKDKANYTAESKTYTFCQANAALPVGVQAWPLLKKLQLAPQVLTPGKGMGVRASVTLRFADMPDTDAMTDPYVAERSYKPEEQGSFWGKFRARNEFYEGRLVTIRTGYLGNGFDDENFQSRVYVIESFKGPDKGGEVQIVAKDVLKLADDNRAQFPPPSNGQLTADISDVDTGFTLKPAGVGDAEYPAGSFRVVIGGEGMDCTRSGGSDAVTITTRDVYEVGASEHKADDTVQIVGRFIDAEIHDVANTLLTQYTPSFNSSWIPYAEWQSERDAFLPGLWETDITEPTGVNTLLGELQEQGCCYLYWDEAAQLVRFRALRPPAAGIPELSEGNDFLEDTVVAGDDPSQRLSRVFVYFDRRDPTKKLDEPSNYRQRSLGADLESEGANEYGSSRVKTIYSRWFRSTSLGRVQALQDTLQKRYSKPPRMMQFEADMSLINTAALADRFVANTRQFQKPSGANLPVNMQVIEVAQKAGFAGSVLQYKAQEYVWNERVNDSSNLRIIIATDVFNLVFYDAFVAEYGAPLATQTVEFIVLDGAEIGSASPALPAIRTGSAWPSGITLLFTNEGKAAGAGGRGGTYLGDGSPGGVAFLAEVPITVNNAGGELVGGGGGGGALILTAFGISGGGGGAGIVPGEAGNALSQPGSEDAGGDGVETVPGTYSGDGGAPGAAGQDAALGAFAGTAYVGGAAGAAVEGNSFITWTATGTRIGPVIS